MCFLVSAQSLTTMAFDDGAFRVEGRELRAARERSYIVNMQVYAQVGLIVP